MTWISFVLLTLLAGAGWAQTQPAPAQTGVCSYYAKRYDGRITAGGKKFNSNELTAAHRTYAMGTKLKLTNTSNDKSVVVVVNDRGPFVKGRDISVTRRAAQELGFLKEGFATVRIEQVQ
jgi:rare lipoprotein A